MSMYDVGDRVRIYTSSAFSDEDGTAVDPDIVTFVVEDPSYNEVSYIYGVDADVSRDGVGLYSLYVNVDEAGIWKYRIEALNASGDYMGADEGSFVTRESRI